MIHEIDNAITYFMENYNREINIEEYASSRGMSVSWFIRNFKNIQAPHPYNISFLSASITHRLYWKPQIMQSMKYRVS